MDAELMGLCAAAGWQAAIRQSATVNAVVRHMRHPLLPAIALSFDYVCPDVRIYTNTKESCDGGQLMFWFWWNSSSLCPLLASQWTGYLKVTGPEYACASTVSIVLSKRKQLLRALKPPQLA